MSFQYKSDAELVYELLKKRMKHFGLSLEEKKTRLIELEDLRKQTEPSEENPNLKHSIFWDLHTTVHMAKTVSSE